MLQTGKTCTEQPFLNWTQLKLAQRVAEAEAVVAARANQLFQDGDGNGEESEALNDALCALRALRSASKFNTSHQVGNDGEMNVA